MIAQAQQFHIPLIELPPNIRFSAITKAVSDEIMRRHTLTLNNVISVNRVLTEIIINGAGLPEIARMISNLTGSSVLISDIMKNLPWHDMAGADGGVDGRFTYPQHPD